MRTHSIIILTELAPLSAILITCKAVVDILHKFSIAEKKKEKRNEDLCSVS
jgi:hypothetical protein